MTHQGVVDSPGSTEQRKIGWQRILLALAWAVPLGFGLDFAVGWIGDHVSRSLYRFDTTTPVVLADESRKIDLLIVGGCRAALNIDSDILGRRLGGVSVFNAGKVVEGLGNVEFTSYVGLSHHEPKVVVIVIDDGNLEESYDQDRTEASAKMPWLPLMAPHYQKQFLAIYQPPAITRVSGLWRYRGQGREITSSSIKALLHRPVPAVDGYAPRPAEQNILATIKSDEAALARNVLRTQRLSSNAEGVIARIIAAAKANGARPVLVVAPMHRFRATDYVNDRQFEIVSTLAQKNRVSAIFYPDNKSQFAHNGIYWSDQGHMNRLGAERFAEILGADLSRLLAKPRNGNAVLRRGSEI
jgi:hypothetical protein